MTEIPAPQPEQKLTSDHFDSLSAALELLYIKSNLSGRNQFTRQWPVVASYLFGEELIGFDRDGAVDKSRRAVLENEAEERRLGLMSLLEELEEKSVDKGALQIEYVRGVIADLGRELALFFYAQRIVDKISPPPAAVQEMAPPPPVQEAPEIIPPPVIIEEPSSALVDDVALPEADLPVSAIEEPPVVIPPPEPELQQPKRPLSFAELAAMSEEEDKG